MAIFGETKKQFEKRKLLSNMKEKKNTRILIWGIVLAFLPIIGAAGYGLYVQIHETFRYDEQYFSAEYQERYDAPGAVARDLEIALQKGNTQLMHELQGLRKSPPPFEPQPNTRFSILFDVDEAGYFHYLFFNFDTLRRSIFFIHEVDNRWVMSPADAHYYWKSGEWLVVYAPPTLTWWIILSLVTVGYGMYRMTAQYRQKHMR